MGRSPGRHRTFGALLALIGAAALVSFGLSSPSSAATTSRAAPTATASVQRVCAAPTAPHMMACLALRRTGIQPDLPSGYGPSDLKSAYKLPSGGSGATVGIVDAQDDPNAESDLASYRSTYGLPACTTANGCFKKVNENGQASPLPSPDSGWAGEISLDVDMVSAVCPSCHILLVEANQPSDADLGKSVNTAVSLGAKYVSNSYGGSEDSSETSTDSYFNHPGVAITASTGDSGNGAEYPATSRYVTAVGGTSLRTASNTRGWTETAWSGAGSGCSAYETKPTWQTVTTGCTRRAEADVSAVADPNTGVAVYQTYGGSGWAVYGGTSASSPIVASVYALAGTPGASDYPASYPYAHQSNLFDVTSGSNGSCGSPLCTAGPGWDGPTGLGTPNGTAAFTAGGGGTGTVTVANPGSRTGTVGTAVTSVTLSASGGTAPYTWSATGLPPGLSIGTSTGTISGTPTTAGTYPVTATAKDAASRTGSTTFTWTISTGGGGGCTASQLLGNPGFESGTSPWSASSGVISANGQGETAHGGTHFAWLDGYGTTHTDTLSQTVTVPATCKAATVSFYLHIDTAETTASTAYDKLTVKAGSTTLATYSNLNKATGYTQRSFSLASFIGQSVALTFTGTEDSSLQTSFVIDDAALNVS